MATQLQLDQARAAYHALMTGQMAEVVVDQNGERIHFVKANAGKLLAYIQQLEVALGGAITNRPMRPFF
jgi:predicted regulator of Ras-like GTPase activity (Roadblock/LC7/MglB family)